VDSERKVADEVFWEKYISPERIAQRTIVPKSVIQQEETLSSCGTSPANGQDLSQTLRFRSFSRGLEIWKIVLVRVSIGAHEQFNHTFVDHRVRGVSDSGLTKSDVILMSFSGLTANYNGSQYFQ